MLCLIHGYSLSGSGSNLWTRSIAHAFCENGEDLHLVCQESRPETLDFVAEAYEWAPDASATRVFAREVPYPGRCILHRPRLAVLPTYVRPPADVTSMKSMLDLSEEEVEDYLTRNTEALRRIVATYDIDAVHVNHVVLMSVVAQRVCTEAGIPFAVMPHGSAIEYVTKHDERMHALATEALTAADRILTLSSEMQDRIEDVFPGVPAAREKMVMASAGVDTRRFRVIARAERAGSAAQLRETIRPLERGRKRAQTEALRRGLRDDLSLEALQRLLQEAADYPPKRPDEGLEELLEEVDWAREEILAFVGKVISYKGVPALVAALPGILQRRPHVRLLVAGRGQLREGLEAFVFALADGYGTLARNIARWGRALEGEEQAPFERVDRFFDELEARGELDAYFEAARLHLTPDRVLFTGYLEHDSLAHLFPCCDVAVFPSVVKEAAPLVVPEAMASGCFPVGMDYAGMATSLDVAARAVPEEVAAHMRIRHDPAYTVRDIVDHVPAALEASPSYREAFRRVAVEERDWRNVARKLGDELRAIRT